MIIERAVAIFLAVKTVWMLHVAAPAPISHHTRAIRVFDGGAPIAGVAAVSRVVCGIGIMNIMLVSVTERTREIGIRMAVGARAGDILVQFLIEAVTLSAIGGATGIACGMLFSVFISNFYAIPAFTPYLWIGIAFVSSALIGIISGFYPAWKASQLDPIDALRYE